VQPGTEGVADFIGGFIAAEGTFVRTGRRPKFVFAVGLGAIDTSTCLHLLTYFGCGRVFHSPRRKAHYDDECSFAIQGLRDHLDVTIPFMDVHLPSSHKRGQYLAWRAALIDYWEHDAKRVRPCSVDGCAAPRRAHGLCRRHLFAVRGV
jgi:hypothetical protein